MTNRVFKGLAALFTILTIVSTTDVWGKTSVNLGEQQPVEKDIVNVTINGINFLYIKVSGVQGASIYRDDLYFGDNSLKITAPKKIVKVEFEGVKSTATSDKTADMVVTDGGGDLTVNERGTSRWVGSSTILRIAGASVKTSYTITTIRVWLEGDGDEDYVGEDVLKRPGADVHYYAPRNNLPTDGKPVTFAVVAHSQFKDALQDYLVWKTQQGYHVEELYADTISGETQKTGDDLAVEIRERLKKLDPQPCYVLLAGDCQEVPYFVPRTAMGGGRQEAVTDYFYGEYTGDHYPEAAVGRFSARTVEQLKAQMDKTKHMSLLKPADAQWLKNSLVVHSPSMQNDGLSTQGAADYGIGFFKKWQENNAEVILRASSWSAINRKINDGCSYVTYLGHGDWNAWFDAWGWDNYTKYHAEQLANSGRYPVVLGLTCLSGSYQYDECLAETFMRKANGGAVAYVGATRESMDTADNLFFGGGSNGYKKFERIGYLRSLYHPDPREDTSQLTRTIGDAVNMGKFASRTSNDNVFRRFSEFFTLFGDPTYQPQVTIPREMTIEAASSIAAGRHLTVKTAPDSVVCVSKGRTIVAVGLANKKGEISLKIPIATTPDTYTLYSSAPFYNDLMKTVVITTGTVDEPSDSARTRAVRVQYKDVVSVETAPGLLPSQVTEFAYMQPDSVGVNDKSPARYTMWCGTNLTRGTTDNEFADCFLTSADTVRAFYLRNNYAQCSFITTTSGGTAAYVEVDWLHSVGQTEILGVYGSNSRFTSTSNAWTGSGVEKLGVIRKGDNNRLMITGNWKYILVRAEDYEGYYAQPSQDQNDVFIKTLTIGWNLLAEETSVTPGTTIEVTATSATEAEELGEIVLADTAAERAGQKKVLKLVATKVTNGKWTLSVEIAPELMEKGHKIDDTVAALGKALSSLALQPKTRAATMSLEIPAESVTPGLYYSVRYASTPDFKTSAESPRVLAKPGEALALEIPADNASTRFFKVKASMTPSGE